jgi:WD40 repeat protein
MNTLRIVFLLPVLSLMSPSAAWGQESPLTDRHGDPLPKGALQRLGTVRYCENSTISAFAFSPDVKQYVTCGRTGGSWQATIGLWDTATGKAIHQLATDAEFFCAVAFAPDGKTVAAASFNDIFIFDAATGKQLRQFEGHPGGIACLAWSPDGKTLAVGGSVNVYRSADGRTSTSRSRAPDDKRRNNVRLLDAETGKLIRELDNNAQPVYIVAFSADGQRLLASKAEHCSRIGTTGREPIRVESDLVGVWDTATGAKLYHFARGVWRRAAVEAVNIIYSRDLTRVAFKGVKGKIQVWDIAAGTQCSVELANPYWSFAFTADGKQLVFGTERGTISLWDAKTGKHVRDFARQSGSAYTLAGVDPTGQYVASVGRSSHTGPTRVHLWDLPAAQS